MMKLNKWLGLVLMLMFLASPVLADEQAVESPKVMSFLQFIEQPGNRGLAWRLLERRYQEYRKGRLPISSLTADNMR